MKKAKGNKLYILALFGLSLFFALTIFLDSMIVYQGGIFSTIADCHFEALGLKNIALLLITWLVAFVVLAILGHIYEIVSRTDKQEEPNCEVVHRTGKQEEKKSERNPIRRRERPFLHKITSGKVFFFSVFLILLVCWLPYVLSYFPGGIFADTISSIWQGTRKAGFSNHSPILYAILLGIVIYPVNNLQLGVELFTVLQILVMDLVLSYGVYWIYKKKVRRIFLVFSILFFALFPLIPFYSISLWKDVPFCLALFLYMLFIAETVYEKGKNLERGKGVLCAALLLFLVNFTRNNGVYITTLTTLVLLIRYRKQVFSAMKAFSIVSILVMLLSFLIQGPIYGQLHWNVDKSTESLGVPLQQVCYVIATGGNISTEQAEFVHSIYPIEAIKETYNPCIVDPIKWAPEFNEAFLENHRDAFLETWFQMFFHNQKAYVEAWLLNTMGFWDVTKADDAGYINPRMWQNADETMGVHQKDYVEQMFGVSIRKQITPEKYISSAVFLFVLLVGMLMTIKRKKYDNLLIYLPALATWLTIMIAAPLAFSLRYVYILVLMVPFSLLLPLVPLVEKEEEK
ncbi:hypothetical protein FACS1894111_02270 [Clostridia bacterium]|nr:hypothetical protein FACS1894111_02270 [Clostridia bacterium]